MYYCLGIVTTRNLVEGDIFPEYVLCKIYRKKNNRSDWIVKSTNEVNRFNKILVTNIAGHEDMISFLSHYVTKVPKNRIDKRRKSGQYKKYTPKGALFWFKCNRFGEMTGESVYIKNIPDKSVKRDCGYQRMIEELNTNHTLTELFSKEPLCLDLSTSNKIIKMV